MGRATLFPDDRFFKQTGCVIIPLSVREFLDEQIAHKLA